MIKHVAISPGEAADRLAIREPVEAYAHCADRRDAKGQMALFTKDTHFVVYMNAKNPSQDLHSRGARSSLRGPQPIRCYDAFRRTEHHLHAER
jgi:SnoaL-like domain